MKVWLNTFPRIGETAIVAREAEDVGFFGLLLTDSQCLFPETFVELCMVAQVTEQLHIGTCASNVVTRHTSVLASQATGLHVESGGRILLGVARGDSAVTKIGLTPLSPTEFGDALTSLRNLVAGRPAENGGAVSTLEWLSPQMLPLPVFGVASGPRTIEAVTQNADGIIL